MADWFTGDTHFGHPLMITPAVGRPFATTDEMDDALVENWNRVVARGDRVIHAGDVSFHRDPERTRKLLQALHGQKYLLQGNHDARNGLEKWADCFVWVKDRVSLKIKDPDGPLGRFHLVIQHFPELSWNQMGHGSWMLHGHCHGNLQILPRYSDLLRLQNLLYWKYLGEEDRRFAEQFFQEAFQLHQARRIDVGMDCWHLTPVSFGELKHILGERRGHVPDHHTR